MQLQINLKRNKIFCLFFDTQDNHIHFHFSGQKYAFIALSKSFFTSQERRSNASNPLIVVTEMTESNSPTALHEHSS